MNNYRINYKENIILLLLGICCPILSIPFVLTSIYKKNVSSIFVLAFVIAIFIGIMPPYADTYHYYLYYKQSRNFVFDWFTTSKDFLFYVLSYIFNSFNIQYIYFRSFLVMLEMLIFSWIFYDYLQRNDIFLENKKYFFCSVIILFLSIDFMFIGFMIRYVLAGTFLILSIYLFHRSNSLISLIFLFLSISSHYGVLLFLPCFVLAWLFRGKITILTKIIICIVFLLSGTLIFHIIYNLLPNFFHVDKYVNGTWSGFEYKSFNGMMYYVIQYYVLSGITILIYVFQRHENNFGERITFFSILMFCCICSFSELSQRVWWILKILISLSLITSIIRNKSNLNLSKLYFLIGLLFLSQTMFVYGFREAIFDLDNLKHLLSPVTFLLGDSYDDYYFFSRRF